MKIFFSIIPIIIPFTIFFTISAGFAADKKEYPASPPAKISEKWRIAYLEGGPWKDYQSCLIATAEALSDLGWTERITIPPQKDISDTSALWSWLASNVRSKYIQFVADAYYSNNWDEEIRKQTKKLILKRLNKDRDIDLMIAMGTWAGQDLANNGHSVPTIVGSTTDPIAAKIIKSADDSGYDHIHVRVDPTRHERQIRAFHDLIGFKKLGVPFKNSVTGRSFAATDKIRKVAKERQFELVPCYMTYPDSKEAEADMIRCARELAPKTDAYYAPQYISINPQTLPEILNTLNKYKIPTFSQDRDFVRNGFLMTVALTKFDGLGMFYAKTIAKIINGAKPRDLNQIYEEKVRIAFNKEAARIIDLRDDIYKLILEIADEVYDETEKPKGKN